jgi:hypothetical protein
VEQAFRPALSSIERRLQPLRYLWLPSTSDSLRTGNIQ